MRRRRLAPLVACWALALAAPAPSRADDGGEPDYRGYVLEVLDGWLRDGAFADPGRLLARGDFHPVAEAAACQVRAFEWTGQVRYAEGAVALIRALVASREKGQEDFFTVYPLMYAYARLEAAGWLDDGVVRDLRGFAARNFAARDVALHNQALQRAAGLAWAARAFADDPKAESWRSYAESVWGLLVALGDVTENASNYNQIDLLYVFRLAEVLGRTDRLRDPRFAAMFRRFLDQVSPSGVVPAYGDSGNGNDDPDWPIRHGWASWPSAFEAAASLYGDPGFRWAAVKTFRTGAVREPIASPHAQAGDLFRLSFAADARRADLAPREPMTGSAVLRRREPGDPEAPDKLILAPGRHDGAPFLLCDLYARGYHAHINQPGAIDYFESGGAPLLFMLGYNNRNPEQTNLVMVREAGEGFPHPDSLFTPGRWNEAALPTSRLAEEPGRPGMRRLSEFSLRVGAGRRGVTLWVDDVRLVGPGGSRPIDPGEAAAGWSKAPALVDDRREGAHALRWEVGPGMTLLTRRGLDLTFDAREFTQIRFAWKLSNADERARPLIFRVPGANDQHCHALQLDPALLDARASSRDRDQFGVLRYRGWFSDGARLSRQMVLTREGVLVVRDELVPDAGLSGRVAGPIWHLAPTTEPRRGANWFDAEGGRVNLLAWFREAPGRTFGVQSVDAWMREGQKTAFARQPLEPGRPAAFVSVLVPHPPGMDAGALAGSIHVSESGDGTTVRLATAEGKVGVTVTIGCDDLWRVERDGP